MPYHEVAHPAVMEAEALLTCRRGRYDWLSFVAGDAQLHQSGVHDNSPARGVESPEDAEEFRAHNQRYVTGYQSNFS